MAVASVTQLYPASRSGGSGCQSSSTKVLAAIFAGTAAAVTTASAVTTIVNVICSHIRLRRSNRESGQYRGGIFVGARTRLPHSHEIPCSGPHMRQGSSDDKSTQTLRAAVWWRICHRWSLRWQVWLTRLFDMRHGPRHFTSLLRS